jgi:hypothetical protein
MLLPETPGVLHTDIVQPVATGSTKKSPRHLMTHTNTGVKNVTGENVRRPAGICKGIPGIPRSNASRLLPPGTSVLDLWLSVLCMRSKAWVAARVSLQLARLRSTRREAAPGLLACAEVMKNIMYFLWVQKLATRRYLTLALPSGTFVGDPATHSPMHWHYPSLPQWIDV